MSTEHITLCTLLPLTSYTQGSLQGMTTWVQLTELSNHGKCNKQSTLSNQSQINSCLVSYVWYVHSSMHSKYSSLKQLAPDYPFVLLEMSHCFWHQVGEHSHTLLTTHNDFININLQYSSKHLIYIFFNSSDWMFACSPWNFDHWAQLHNWWEIQHTGILTRSTVELRWIQHSTLVCTYGSRRAKR